MRGEWLIRWDQGGGIVRGSGDRGGKRWRGSWLEERGNESREERKYRSWTGSALYIIEALWSGFKILLN